MFISNKLSRLLMVMCVAVLSTGAVFAQNLSITGKVTDKKGEPLAGVYVLIEGTKNGTSTNANGLYQIPAPSNAKLVFTSMGFKDVVVQVSGRSTIDIVLEDDALMLEETVVTALGIKKEKKALGYAVEDIKSEELLKNKSTNVINSLAGKIAGVNITQSGGSAGSGSTIIIRGGTSLERDNQPLFVVDGVIYNNSTNIGGNSGFDGAMRTATSFSNRVMDINPEDVENMSILKGPSASALYGSKAAAGVVIITTKKGAEGKVQVNFNSKFTSSWVNRLPEQQSTYMRGYYEQTGAINDFTIESWGAKFGEKDVMYNNISDFFKRAQIYDNNISISGGNKNGTFYISASNYKQSGIIPKTGYEKTTFRFNGDQKYGRLTVGANVAYAISDTDKTFTSGGLFDSGGTGAMVSVYRWSRNDDIRHYLNDDGTKYYMFKEWENNPADAIENPHWIINKNKITESNHRFTGSLSANMDVTDWFKITYRLGYDNYTTRDHTFIHPGAVIRITYQNGKMSETDVNYEYISSNLMLNFNKKFSDFDFNLLLGQSIEDTKNNTERRDGWNFVIDKFYSFENIAKENKKFQSLHSRRRLMGIYGEFRTSYKNIAYLTITGRNDWTSTLPVENRSYFYPSISGSFVFTEIIPKNDILSFGKVRASWAKVGKDTDPYSTQTTLWPALTFLGGLGVGNSWTKGNPYLVPEMTESTEFGLEMRFLNGRLGLDYTYYNNNSIDQIVIPRLSQATGYILLSTNVGNVRNKGMEFSITGTPISTKDFSWDMTLSFAGNRGRVYNLLTGQDVLYVTDVQVGNAKAASFNTLYSKSGKISQTGLFAGISGQKWSRSIVYNENGDVIESDPNHGKVILNSITGLPTSDGSTTSKVGNRESTVAGGFNNNIRYKNWNLSFLLDYRIGGDIYNGTDYFMTMAGMSKRSTDRESLTITGLVDTGNRTDGYNSKGESVKVPVYEEKTFTYKAGEKYNIKGIPTAGENIIQSYWKEAYVNEAANFITKTNWLRLRSVSLSYNFTKLLKKQTLIKGLVATVSGNNLFLLTNYKGMDPETSVAGSGVIGSSSAGIDYCGVPSTMGVSFGLNITF